MKGNGLVVAIGMEKRMKDKMGKLNKMMEGSDEEDDYEEADERYVLVAREVLDAVKEDDEEALAEALQSFVNLCME